MSHSYHAGACLYFTFGYEIGEDPHAEYAVIKSAIQQAFIDNGGTLSHHHAVGTEHAEWLEQDISAPGVGMLRALFEACAGDLERMARELLGPKGTARQVHLRLNQLGLRLRDLRGTKA